MVCIGQSRLNYYGYYASIETQFHFRFIIHSDNNYILLTFR